MSEMQRARDEDGVSGREEDRDVGVSLHPEDHELLPLPGERGSGGFNREEETATHFFCHTCSVVVPIVLEAAAEVAKHANHPCEYTVIRT